MMQTLVNWLRKAWYCYQKPPQSALQLIRCEWVSEHDYTVAWCCDRCPYLEWIADGKRICHFPGEDGGENQLACRPANRHLKRMRELSNKDTYTKARNYGQKKVVYMEAIDPVTDAKGVKICEIAEYKGQP